MKDKDLSGPIELSMDSLADADTASMNVVIGGQLSGWFWEFSGPGHPKTIEQANRTSRASLLKSKQIEQAQVNGKKWHATDETPDSVRASNVTYVIERIVGWGPIKIDGADYPFTPENAKALLSDPRRASLLLQCLEFLAADGSFTKRSATT